MHGHKNIPSANPLFAGIIHELTLFSTLVGEGLNRTATRFGLLSYFIYVLLLYTLNFSNVT
jgi:hypothetical protein